MKIQFPDKMASVLFEPSRYKVFYGGRGSGKSINIARALLVQAHTSKQKVLCTREIQHSITESVHATLSQQIEEIGLSGFYEIQKTTIKHRLTGSEFLFAGLRTNINNIKSIPDISRCWIEEAQTVSRASMQVLIPTIRAEKSEIWLSFNPELEDDEVYQDFVVDPPSDAVVMKMDYTDNPFFPEVLRKEMEDCKRKDYQRYLHIWEGRPRQAVDGAIFADEINTASEEHRFTKVLPQAGVPVHTFWDLGHSDNTAIWFTQLVGMEYRLLDYYQASGQKMSHYVEVLAARDYAYERHYLPHDATHEQLAAQSTIKQQLSNAIRDNPKLGKEVRVVPRIPKKALAIDAAREIFPRCVFDKEKTADGIQCLRHARYRRDEQSGKVSKEPVHDIWSHGVDAFLCLAQHGLPPKMTKPKQSAPVKRRIMI